ncbi:hypothetical protein LguiB_018676 [Lonicera macranthoides]
METQTVQKRPRILCLHGFRTSAEILKKLVGRWPENLLEKLELVFLDGPYLAQGKSGVDGLYDPPYYEWFQSNKEFTEYYNFEECVEYLEEYMLKHGPFDGLLGFSPGAVLLAALLGMQVEGVALKRVPKLKFGIMLSGAKFGGPKLGLPKLATNAFSSPIKCPSLHFVGETDFLKEEGIFLAESFTDPLVIHHPEGHTIPILDDKSLETFQGFIEKVQNLQFPEENN